MALTTEGKYCIADAIIGGASYTKFGSANAHLVVGTGTGPEAVGDTVNTFTDIETKAVDSAVRGSGAQENVVTYQATFGTGDANQDWDEWGVANATGVTGELLNRKVEALGTKGPTQTWVFTVDITFGA